MCQGRMWEWEIEFGEPYECPRVVNAVNGHSKMYDYL